MIVKDITYISTRNLLPNVNFKLKDRNKKLRPTSLKMSKNRI